MNRMAIRTTTIRTIKKRKETPYLVNNHACRSPTPRQGQRHLAPYKTAPQNRDVLHGRVILPETTQRIKHTRDTGSKE